MDNGVATVFWSGEVELVTTVSWGTQLLDHLLSLWLFLEVVGGVFTDRHACKISLNSMVMLGWTLVSMAVRWSRWNGATCDGCGRLSLMSPNLSQVEPTGCVCHVSDFDSSDFGVILLNPLIWRHSAGTSSLLLGYFLVSIVSLLAHSASRFLWWCQEWIILFLVSSHK